MLVASEGAEICHGPPRYVATERWRVDTARVFASSTHLKRACIAVACAAAFATPVDAARVALPSPNLDLPAQQALQKAVLAGGCFWGVELVFEHVKGVHDVRSGYAGGKSYLAHYASVASGDTGHAESVEITYDPQQISYGELLRVFFSVAHDPTQLNRQGPDEGTQYRSTIFVTNADQERVARAYIDQLRAARAFDDPIVTTLQPLQAFYAAEAEHQDYATRNPRQPYIVMNDRPKLFHLQQQFPALFKER
jgi:peptide-methionine (S)-S-oxide reductase